jgi:hypothetical protein
LYEAKNSLEIDEYLPQVTLAWCREKLMTYDIDLDEVSASAIDQLQADSGERLFKRAYALLRLALQLHIRTQAEPILTLCTSLIGGYDRVAGSLSEIVEENAEFVRRGQELEEELAFEEAGDEREEPELRDEVMEDN